MAILYSDVFEKCKHCNSTNFKSEKSGTLRKEKNTYYLESNKMLVCCNCNKVHAVVNNYSKDSLVEL